MSTQPGSEDSLHSSLSPLVSSGTLTPYQADQVYLAVQSSRTATSPDRHQEMPGWQRPRLLAALNVLFAGLLGTAFLLGALVALLMGFEWKTFIVLLAVALALAVAAAGSLFLLRARPGSPWVAGVLAALALAAFAFGLVVLWDADIFGYVAGMLMLAGGAAGYWRLKGHLFAVVAVVGGVTLLGQLFTDVSLDAEDPNNILMVGIAFLFYGLVVTAVGWRLTCRHLLGILGLGIGLSSMALVIYLNALFYAFTSASGGGPADSFGPSPGSINSDIRIAMIMGVAIAVVAALCHAYTGYVGFAILSFLGAAVLPVSGVASLQSEHPLRWAGAFVVVGALALAALVAAQLERRGQAPHPATPSTRPGQQDGRPS